MAHSPGRKRLILQSVHKRAQRRRERIARLEYQAEIEAIVWSEEHGGWWMAGSMGYTPSLREAGRFTEERAKLIEDRANRYLPNGAINEVAMPDPWPRPTADQERAFARRDPRQSSLL